jgi:predicted Zn finger-like uncharacterized protein
MAIRINCPACKAPNTVDEEKRGRKVRCRKCDEQFSVPAESAAEAKKKSAADTAIQANRKMKATAARKRYADDDVEDENQPSKKTTPKKQAPAKGSSAMMFIALGGVAVVLLFCLAGAGGVGGYFWLRSGNEKQVAKVEPQVEDKKDKDGKKNEPVNDKLPPDNGGDKKPIVQIAPIPDGPAPASMNPDVVKKVKKASVYVKVTDATGQTGEGSGFFGLEPGVVITNAHVVGMLGANSKPPKKVEVVIYSGTPQEFKLQALVLGADRENDLAVLRLDGDLSKIPESLPVESDCSLTEVQGVYIFGFPLGAQLGKEITVSTSTVSSFRRDVDGSLSQIQVNGGMHPGNSGGPIVDTRGVVVGVSVSGYRGTQLNFAVPAEKIHGMLHGRIQEIALGEAFFHDKTVKLPVKISCLDPLQRVRDLKVDVWTGPAGPSRRPGLKAPDQLPGDSAKQSATLKYQQGLAAHELELSTLNLPAGHVYWIQPTLTTHAGLQKWAASTTYNPVGAAPLNRVPATLKFNTATSERGLKLAGKFEFQMSSGKEKLVESENLNFEVLEEMTTDPKGAALRVAMGKGQFTTFEQNKTIPRHAEAQNLVKRRIYAYTAAHNGRLEVFTFQRFGPPPINPKGKGKPPPPPSLEMQIRYAEADDMASMFNSTYQLACLSVPNREVKPLEVWDERIALLVGNAKKRTTIDVIMKYTYEGSRTVGGKSEAVITITGEVEKRNSPKDPVSPNRPKSRIVGQGCFDPASGYFSKLKVAIRNDGEFDGRSFSQIFEVNLTRTTGNVYQVAPLPPRTEPGPGPGPGKVVLNENSSLAANDPIDPKSGRKAPMKVYPVQLLAGKEYAISLDSTAFDAYLRLEDPSGKTVAEDDDSGGSLNALIRYRPTQTGQFKIVCTTFDGKLGAFQLKVTDLSAGGTTDPKGGSTKPIGTPVPNAPPQPKAPAGTPGKVTVDLIPLIDPGRDPVHGKWFVGDNILHCNHMHLRPRIQIPYQPPAEYDYIVTFSQPKQRNGISLLMPNPHGGSSICTIASNNGKDYGFHLGGRENRKPLPTAIMDNTPHTTIVQVRKEGLTVLLDGVELVNHKTDFRDLVNNDQWFKIPDPKLLGLACDEPTIFHYVQVVEITGAGVKTLAGPGPGPKGKVVFQLHMVALLPQDQADPTPSFKAKNARMKVLPGKFEGGKTYSISASSNAFDLHLRVEDAQAKKLAEQGGTGNNPRALTFRPTETGVYRVVIAGADGKTGLFEITILELAPDDSKLPATGDFKMPAKSEQPTSYLKIVSSPGEYIGQGKSYDYAGDQLVVKATKTGVNVQVGGWNLNIQPPAGEALKVREYAGATRSGNDASPRLEFSGNGRGNNRISGEFVVWELEMDGDRIVRLAIDFVQRGDRKQPLTGKLRVNSTLQ